MTSMDTYLDLGGSLWVSSVVEAMVPREVLLRAVRRHRRYEVCWPLGVGEMLATAVYVMNSQAMDLITNHHEVDADGWLPRFASLWTVPLSMTDSGELKSSRYWIVTDMLGGMQVRDEGMGTLVVSGNELRRYGQRLFRGGGRRDVSDALALMQCRNIWGEIFEEELDPEME